MKDVKPEVPLLELPESELRAVEEALKQMRELPGVHWAAYQNHAMDSSGLGKLRFLAIGEDCTFKEPPKRFPDSHLGTGWAYLFVGWVDTNTGKIKGELS